MKTRSLKVGEEERSILDDRAADQRAELIAMQRRFRAIAGRVEVISGIQRIVSKILVQAAMEIVGTRLECGVYRRAAAAEFRLHGILFHAEFSDGIGGRIHGDGAVADAVVVDAIEKEVVVKGP